MSPYSCDKVGISLVNCVAAHVNIRMAEKIDVYCFFGGAVEVQR